MSTIRSSSFTFSTPPKIIESRNGGMISHEIDDTEGGSSSSMVYSPKAQLSFEFPSTSTPQGAQSTPQMDTEDARVKLLLLKHRLQRTKKKKLEQGELDESTLETHEKRLRKHRENRRQLEQRRIEEKEVALMESMKSTLLAQQRKLKESQRKKERMERTVSNLRAKEETNQLLERTDQFLGSLMEMAESIRYRNENHYHSYNGIGDSRGMSLAELTLWEGMMGMEEDSDDSEFGSDDSEDSGGEMEGMMLMASKTRQMDPLMMQQLVKQRRRKARRRRRRRRKRKQKEYASSSSSSSNGNSNEIKQLEMQLKQLEESNRMAQLMASSKGNGGDTGNKAFQDMMVQSMQMQQMMIDQLMRNKNDGANAPIIVMGDNKKKKKKKKVEPPPVEKVTEVPQITVNIQQEKAPEPQPVVVEEPIQEEEEIEEEEEEWEEEEEDPRTGIIPMKLRKVLIMMRFIFGLKSLVGKKRSEKFLVARDMKYILASFGSMTRKKYLRRICQDYVGGLMRDEASLEIKKPSLLGQSASKNRERVTKISSRAGLILSRLVTDNLYDSTGGEDSPFYGFVYKLTSPAYILPEKYFFITEAEEFDFDINGAIKNVGEREARMLVLNFFIVRNLVAEIVLRPWNHGIYATSPPHGKTTITNMRMIATMIYIAVRAALSESETELAPAEPWLAKELGLAETETYILDAVEGHWMEKWSEFLREWATEIWMEAKRYEEELVKMTLEKRELKRVKQEQIFQKAKDEGDVSVYSIGER